MKEKTFNKALNIKLGLSVIKKVLNKRELGGIVVEGDKTIVELINELIDETKYFADAWYNGEEL